MITALLVSIICLVVVTASLGILLYVEHSVSSALRNRIVENSQRSKRIEEDLCKDIKVRYEQLNAAYKQIEHLRLRSHVEVSVLIGTEKYPPGFVFRSKAEACKEIGIRSHKALSGRNRTLVINGYTLKIN